MSEDTPPGSAPSGEPGPRQALRVTDRDVGPEEFVARVGGRLVADVVSTALAKVEADLPPETSRQIMADLSNRACDPLERMLAYVVPQTVADAVARKYNRDPSLGRHSRYVSTGAAIPKRSGDLLTTGVALIFDGHPDFVVVREPVVPVTEEALAGAKKRRLRDQRRAKRRRAQGKKQPFAPKRRRTARYVPAYDGRDPFFRLDLIVFDRRMGIVWFLESKRGGGATANKVTAKVADELEAARTCADAWLAHHGITGVTDVRVGVIDHLGRCGAARDLTITGGTMDETFGIPGLDAVADRVHGALACAADEALGHLAIQIVRSLGYVVLDPEVNEMAQVRAA